MHPREPERRPFQPPPPPMAPPPVTQSGRPLPNPPWDPTGQAATAYAEQMRQSVPLPPHGPLRYGQPQPLPHGAQQYGQAPQQPYVIPPRPFNHGKHVIADLLTFGFWVPFHLLLWALHPRKSTIVYPDGRRERR